jgi:hypothetical protein
MGVIISVWNNLFFRYKQNNCLKHVIDYNPDKDGSGNWRYTLKIMLGLMLILMFYNMMCISERRTHVIFSIIFFKSTQILYTLLGYISPICLVHVSAKFLATIGEALWWSLLLSTFQVHAIEILVQHYGIFKIRAFFINPFFRAENWSQIFKQTIDYLCLLHRVSFMICEYHCTGCFPRFFH